MPFRDNGECRFESLFLPLRDVLFQGSSYSNPSLTFRIDVPSCLPLRKSNPAGKPRRCDAPPKRSAQRLLMSITQRSFQRRSPRLVDWSRLVQQYATRGLRGLYSSMSLALPEQTSTASQGPQATNERYYGNTSTTVLSCLSHNRLWDSMQQLTSETSRSLLISPTSVSVPRPCEVFCPALVFRLAAHTVNRT